MKYYVAYGSNLNVEQMGFRCPKSTIYGSGRLNDYELVFRGYNANAHATIIPKKGASVPVLVWKVPVADEKMLDRYEGYPNYYFKKDIDVIIDGKVVTCMVYIMNLSKATNRPSLEYVEIIWQGYIDNGFDTEELFKMLKNNAKSTDKRGIW